MPWQLPVGRDAETGLLSTSDLAGRSDFTTSTGASTPSGRITYRCERYAYSVPTNFSLGTWHGSRTMRTTVSTMSSLSSGDHQSD